jgi:hypothetical protein
MASLNLKLEPFPVPTNVTVIVPSSGKREDGIRPPMTVPLEMVDEQTLNTMIEEFALAVMTAAGKA